MRVSTLLVGITGLFAVASSVPASAQTQEQIDWCVNKGNAYAPDVRINGCTALIQSGRLSMQGLAKVYNNRCFAHNDAGDYDRALPDCDEAIRLDPKFSLGRETDAWTNTPQRSLSTSRIVVTVETRRAADISSREARMRWACSMTSMLSRCVA